MRRVLLAPLLVVPAALGAHVLAATAFRRRTQALVAGLGRAAAAEGASASPVPEIVRAYARRAAPGGPVPATIRLRQRGGMRLGPGGPWRPLTAEQTISVREPGFVWLADVRLAPLFRARVVDAYVGGEGLLEARLLGSVPLARSAGSAVGRGELMRYLAELVWVPQAMLGNPRLRWRELGGDVVEVSAEGPDGPVRVRLVFEDGDITRVEADDRPRTEGGRTVPRRWIGRFSDYREVNGHRIPTRGEVSWVLEDGPFAYWRGEVTAFETR